MRRKTQSKRSRHQTERDTARDKQTQRGGLYRSHSCSKSLLSPTSTQWIWPPHGRRYELRIIEQHRQSCHRFCAVMKNILPDFNGTIVSIPERQRAKAFWIRSYLFLRQADIRRGMQRSVWKEWESHVRRIYRGQRHLMPWC